MQDVCCLIIFACLLATVFARNSSTGYQANPNIQKKTCRNRDNTFKVTNVPTSLTCSSICASDEDCTSFFYFPASLKCDGCRQTYSTDGQLKGAGEHTVYYTMAAHLTTTSTTVTAITTTTTTTSTKAEQRYLYIGCYYIPPCDVEPNACSDTSKVISGINVAACFDYCDDSKGVKVSTVAIEIEYCYCGISYDNLSFADCDTPCSGNTDEMCGGNYVISVYSKE